MARMVFKDNVAHLSDEWSIDDVRCVIDDQDIEAARNFTDEDCVRVLKWVVRGFDACIGVNWDVISVAIDIVISEKLKEVPDALV